MRLPVAFSFLCLTLHGQYSLDRTVSWVAADAAEPDSAVVAAVPGGLFRSIDGGFRWVGSYPNAPGEVQPALNQLLSDPAAPGVFYAATDASSGGILKTTDGGVTWTRSGSGLPPASVEALVFSGGSFFARVADQVFRSDDQAATWRRIGAMPAGTRGLAVSLANSNTQYCWARTTLYRSPDGGAQWSISASISASDDGAITSVATDPVDAKTLYVALRGQVGNGVYRSREEGGRLVRLVATQPSNILAFQGADGQTVLLAADADTTDADRSGDGGNNWTRTRIVASPGGIRFGPAPKNPRLVWAATRQGLFVSTDGGVRWALRGGSLRPTLAKPAIRVRFRLAAGSAGRLEVPIQVAETNLWSVPVMVTKGSEAWLSLSAIPAFTPSRPVASVDTAGLAPGRYTSSIRVASSDTPNAVDIPVELEVLAAASASDSRIATVAGFGAGSFGEGGPATRAGIGSPDSLAFDRVGNLYFTVTGSHLTRRVETDGILRRFAGNGEPGFRGDDGQATLASLSSPRGIVFDPAGGGSMLILDAGNNRVRRVTLDGSKITTAVQGGANGRGMVRDEQGNLWVVVTSGHRVDRISPQGSVTRVAGSGEGGFSGDGQAAVDAQLSNPEDIALDAAGNLYIADTGNHRIRMVTPDGTIRTIAGNGLAGYQGDGWAAADTALFRPAGVVVNRSGVVYFSDTGSHRIRAIRPDGTVSTVVGTGVAGLAGDGGPAERAQLRGPSDLLLDLAGNIYVADTLNFRIRRIVLPPTAAVPALNPGGWVNLSSGALSPGGLFSLYGASLAAGPVPAGEVPLPRSLGGVTVRVNGQPVPLVFVSPGQINGQLPFDTAPGQATVQVETGGARSNELTAEIRPAAPAILVYGENRAVAQNATGALITTDAPAAAGGVIVAYLTGIGAVDQPVATGEASPSAAVARARGAASATIGSEPAAVQFLGLVPGFVGLAQANLGVPAGLTAGDYPLVVTVDGAASNAPMLAVGAQP